MQPRNIPVSRMAQERIQTHSPQNKSAAAEAAALSVLKLSSI
jgi:hypothetical protein